MKSCKLYSCVLRSSDEYLMENALERIRCWPFVKAYLKRYPKLVVVYIYVHTKCRQRKRQHYLTRAQELVSNCLKQEHIKVGKHWRHVRTFNPHYSSNLFSRPDINIKSFSVFIDELDKAYQYE